MIKILVYFFLKTTVKVVLKVFEDVQLKFILFKVNLTCIVFVSIN